MACVPYCSFGETRRLTRCARSEEFFEICVSSPAQVPSALQWEALKKLVLVQCIARGKVRRQPARSGSL
jgi:COP9 signalosome complex subunit 3